MGKNRKYQSTTVRMAPAARAILLCILIGGSGVGYVLQKNQIYELGRQIEKREVSLERMRYQNKLSSDRLAALQRPERLAERVNELRLGLAAPQPGQWIHLIETAQVARFSNEPVKSNDGPALLVFGR